MHILSIIRIVGLLVALFSSTMLLPAMVAFGYRDGGGAEFVSSFFIALLLGVLLWFPNRHHKKELRSKEGFLIVVLFWTVLGSVGAVPFIIGDVPGMSVSEAFFESFSGLTTTGATVLTGLDNLPKAFLFYRQLLQWLGGMGIIVLAVAILPLLGIGGMQLYRAEIPGPVKDTKVTPRIAETAKALWFIYLLLTMLCALAYWLAGMSLFDAICHSFSSLSIGGFSTHDDSIGFFNSPAINLITVCFLLIGSINFGLHFMVFTHTPVRLLSYLRDPEVKVFLGIQLFLFLFCAVVLLHHNHYEHWQETLNHALFQSVSLGTTTGYSTTSYADWPSILPMMLMFSSFIGCCAGSTGGGIKVMRFMILFMQGVRELKRLVHPRAVYTLKLGRKAVSDRIVEAVWGFFATYIILFVLFMLALIATGMNEVTAFSAVAATLTNVGPGLGDVASNFAGTSAAAKWILILAMLFGRLEIFTLLVLFTPAFWRS
ncbi:MULTISPECIES: TrkH family potassium uptake protein [Aeromonas]|uniref:TrkH family potassium uptake protein n=1 Tax=Aeromonas TaxID=642 RepID=UPI0012F1B9CC|nr:MULTISPECIES: TrkH family potassium uptake protein [Aeromonas]MDF2403556.1 potassium transporter [Aeromonas sp. 5HA1]VXA80934.1 potassium transporter [Aeromonas salmonicida]